MGSEIDTVGELAQSDLVQETRRTTSTTKTRHDDKVPKLDVNTLEAAEDSVKAKADKVRKIHENRASKGTIDAEGEDSPAEEDTPKLSPFETAVKEVKDKAQKTRDRRRGRIHDGTVVGASDAGGALKEKGKTIGERGTSRQLGPKSVP